MYAQYIPLPVFPDTFFVSYVPRVISHFGWFECKDVLPH
jgi:hypothetical protein